MVEYRNVRHGRIVQRPAPDEFLEASAGWERVDELCDYVPTPDGADDDERTDDDGGS